MRATKPAEVEKTLREAFSIDKPVLMDFRVSREECVYPIVRPGESLSEMDLGTREMIN
jgi:acetolactate synthase-1/2/3 large subunit